MINEEQQDRRVILNRRRLPRRWLEESTPTCLSIKPINPQLTRTWRAWSNLRRFVGQSLYVTRRVRARKWMGDRFYVAFLWVKPGRNVFRKAFSHKNNEGEASSDCTAPITLPALLLPAKGRTRQLIGIAFPLFCDPANDAARRRISIGRIKSRVKSLFEYSKLRNVNGAISVNFWSSSVSLNIAKFIQRWEN